MPDRFDPGDFDTPPPRPGATPSGKEAPDYRPLLDAIAKAAGDGIAEPIRRILARIDQDADMRASWEHSAAASLAALQQTATSAQQASARAEVATGRLTRHALFYALGAALAVVLTAWASLAWLRHDVESLKAERAQLQIQVAEGRAKAEKLRLRGAELEWETCNVKGTFRDKQRKCVRIAVPDGTTGKFGSGPYYAIPEGY